MRRILMVAVTALATMAIAPTMASAWSGAKINSVSCPEIHVNLPRENGPWKVLAVDEAGRQLVNVNVLGDPYEQIVGGLWMVDNATHRVTVTIGNAANINDGKVTRVTQMTNCAPPPGVQGPKGDPGTPGIGYDCAGKPVASVDPATQVGGTPALCPGTPGTSTTKTIIIREAPKTCESNRRFAFRVRRSYMGQRVTSAKASYEAPAGEGSIKPTIKHEHGRLVVRWSTSHVKFTAGGVVRSITVTATLANGKHVRLQWLFRPCMGKNGNLNDPSAAGQGVGGGTSASTVT